MGISFFTLAIRCATIGSPGDGSVSFSNGYNYGSVATYVCRSSFALLGVNERTCGGDGKWTGQPPRCVRKYHWFICFSIPKYKFFSLQI